MHNITEYFLPSIWMHQSYPKKKMNRNHHVQFWSKRACSKDVYELQVFCMIYAIIYPRTSTKSSHLAFQLNGKLMFCKLATLTQYVFCLPTEAWDISMNERPNSAISHPRCSQICSSIPCKWLMKSHFPHSLCL